MAENAAALLRKAETEEALASEVLEGGLNPALQVSGERKTPAELEEAEDDESDEVFVQIKMLLKSAMNSGQLRSLARAIVLAWQAGYDSKLLRQAEPKMVRKAQEVRLSVDLQKAVSDRDRLRLSDCLGLATELGLTQANYPPLGPALRLNRELEEEIRRTQDEARPGHTEKMHGVIAELHRKLIGHDVVELQKIVIEEAEVAEASMKVNNAKLDDALARLKKCRAMHTCSAKLSELRDLQEIFHEVNPRNLEQAVKLLSEQVDDLREDNARLMLSMRQQGCERDTGEPGTKADVVIQDSGSEIMINGEAVSEEILGLHARIAELEENEEVLKGRIDQAAKLGAKWMEEKKNAEMEELRKELANNAQAAQDAQAAAKTTDAAEIELQVKRRVMEIQQKERKLKVAALEGLERSLNKRHEENLAHQRAQFEQQAYAMQMELENAFAKIRQMEKLMRMR
mmetsp:Transcript_22791/g.44791  ORF Transcript_22791/g.44791 Transcript_22791/m.44791 type:complete len:457 (-) Transcript_22791:395-1765(-)|eukprot:CAMPEP_0171497818 /NCGR_PEP_ID=MMETSP0958-20121227/7488_1 /TAXON_ID=87120 /ORGANISM="Aurantiochytrium limacinum, Strain ATCCMYA-1381" /LENGTH=456 /DNA_ID=CAMNT_0012032113 /DNA_START=645 /DNA_END=2015 /DNA_ORIENTATION=+